jgi:hypothetical protein
MGAALHGTGHPASTLTPDCDPDLAHCGSPDGAGGSTPGGRLRSTVALVAVLAAGAALATASAVPGAVAFGAGGLTLLSALVLAVRGLRSVDRLADRVAQGASSLAGARASWAPAVRRSRPVG